MSRKTRHERYKKLLQIIQGGDNIHPYPTISVVGTDGKGSVTSMTASVLIECGYSVGIFRSPKVHINRDMINVNGEMIGKDDYIRLKNVVIDIIKKNNIFPITDNGLKYPYGIVDFIVSLLYFKEKNIDIAVIEATTGYKTCPTSIIKPIISLLTNIDNEQTKLFGNSIEKLAIDKSHVIQTGIPVFIGEIPKNENVKNIVLERLNRCEHPLAICDSNSDYDLISEYKSNGKYITKTGIDIDMELSGDYQYYNLNLVLHTMQELKKWGWNISDDAIKDGLKNVSKNTGFCGRWQILNEIPKVIYDSCHTPFAWEKVAKQLKSMKYNKLHIIFQVCKDKDIDAIMSNFTDKENIYYYFPYYEKKPRFAHPELLMGKTEWMKKSKRYYIGTFKDTLESIIDKSNEEDIIFIGGTTYVAYDANIFFKN